MQTVAVTGMGMVTSAGLTVADNWDSIASGRCSLGKVTAFNTDKYRVDRGGQIDPGLVCCDDPAYSFAIKAAAQALTDADCDAKTTALVMGTNMGSMMRLERAVTEDDEMESLTAASLGDLTERLAAGLGCQQFVTVSGSCASSAIAVGMAVDLIRSGMVDAALVGGTDELTEFKFSGHHLVGSMTSDEIRPFDRDRSGMLLGEGAGFMVLERADRVDDRSANICAYLTGYGSSNDAHHITSPDASGNGAALAINRALIDANVSPEKIDYINAHGTATHQNDVMETKALRSVFGNRVADIPCTSQKPIFGHLLGAASIVEAITTVLVLEHQLLPPTINFNNSDPGCDVDCVPNTARQGIVNYAISNSFGFGGINACLVLSRSR